MGWWVPGGSRSEKHPVQMFIPFPYWGGPGLLRDPSEGHIPYLPGAPPFHFQRAFPFPTGFQKPKRKPSDPGNPREKQDFPTKVGFISYYGLLVPISIGFASETGAVNSCYVSLFSEDCISSEHWLGHGKKSWVQRPKAVQCVKNQNDVCVSQMPSPKGCEKCWCWRTATKTRGQSGHVQKCSQTL